MTYAIRKATKTKMVANTLVEKDQRFLVAINEEGTFLVSANELTKDEVVEQFEENECFEALEKIKTRKVQQYSCIEIMKLMNCISVKSKSKGEQTLVPLIFCNEF